MEVNLKKHFLTFIGSSKGIMTFNLTLEIGLKLKFSVKFSVIFKTVIENRGTIFKNEYDLIWLSRSLSRSWPRSPSGSEGKNPKSLVLCIYTSISLVRDILLYRDFWITLYMNYLDYIINIRHTIFSIVIEIRTKA